jgi:hypothetical protein
MFISCKSQFSKKVIGIALVATILSFTQGCSKSDWRSLKRVMNDSSTSFDVSAAQKYKKKQVEQENFEKYLSEQQSSSIKSSSEENSNDGCPAGKTRTGWAQKCTAPGSYTAE